MTLKVKVGEPFDNLEAHFEEKSVDAVKADTVSLVSKTRRNIAYWAISGGTLFLASSGIMGAYDGSFDELQSVWNVFGPITGAIVGHYYGGENGKKNQE